jgi:hypothetical protein
MPPTKLKLLICFTTLSLIIGCVPSFATPTPIPPLDPNTINVFIAQTADAASVQTIVAMPTFTSTVTFTPTPRNTFTPEPTVTPIQTFLLPSPSPIPISRTQYYRVKHDYQLAIYNYKSRTFDGNAGLYPQAPEVVPMFIDPKTTSGTLRTNVSGAWETYINALNNNDQKKLNYLKSDITALFNTAGFPQLESLTMGGNIITLDEIQGEWGRVHALDHSSPPNAAEVNYLTSPDLIHKFVVVGWRRSTKTTILVRPPRGDLYWPLVTRKPVWIQMERLEPFPILPMEVTANTDLYIQPTPGPSVEETRLQLSTGQTANILAYHPTGPDVWGRVQGGWIPLLLNRQFMTSWTMATVPPP